MFTSISLNGVDGSGKSTILHKIKTIIETQSNTQVLILRQRPSILPILSSFKFGKKEAEQRATNSLPRMGGNNSALSSCFRFSYYLADYILGQWIIYLRFIFRNNVVILYDRYYFDYIIDPKRANIVLNKSVARFFYRFIFKPELNILLYADAEVILERKQELDSLTITRVTSDFIELFKELEEEFKGEYICIENIDEDKTLDLIKAILNKI